jgi:hypothetical protein
MSPLMRLTTANDQLSPSGALVGLDEPGVAFAVADGVRAGAFAHQSLCLPP